MQLQGREDPVFFGEKFLGMQFYPSQKLWLWITTKTRKEMAKEFLRRMGICFTTPENFDSDVDKLYNEIYYHIFCVANQCGKTVMTAVKHLWCAYYKIGKISDAEIMEIDDYKTLNVSPHSDQANKCFEYVQRICRGEMVWYDPKLKKTVKNEPHVAMSDFIVGVNNMEKEIRFSNGATFWSKSVGQDKGTARAGEQFGMITFDEASQALKLQETIPALASRMLRYGFCFDIVSTPEAEKPSHAYYMRLVKQGVKLEGGWFALTQITLDDNVFIDPEQKRRAKESLFEIDPLKYQQIVQGKFISVGTRMFPLHAVSHIFSDNNCQMIQFAKPTRKYIMSADWSMADGEDKTWILVLDYTDYLQNKYSIVYHEVMCGDAPQIQYGMARDIFNRFGGDKQCKFIMDSSSMGGTIIKRELIDLRPIDFVYQYGNKEDMMMFLQQALTFNRKYTIDKNGNVIEENPNYGKLRSYYIQALEDQLANYKMEDKKLEQDGVMAAGQAIYFIEKLPKNQELSIDINPMSRYNYIRTNKRRRY